MTFLQSQILYALPLILLPIVIHLINQNRHKTVQWAATMFLLQAKRMVRGMAKLRYVLILIARMLAVAGLLLAISRPMSGGWLGLAGGGAPELTVIILDRSASMELQDPQSGLSRRDTALEKVSGLFRDRWQNFLKPRPQPLLQICRRHCSQLPNSLPPVKRVGPTSGFVRICSAVAGSRPVVAGRPFVSSWPIVRVCGCICCCMAMMVRRIWRWKSAMSVAERRIQVLSF
jgi:hypothetical protein